MTGPVQMTSRQEVRAAAEQIARSYVQRGLVGADLFAHLLDLLEEQRSGRVVTAGWFETWEQAAGFADAGPEVT